SVVSGQKYSLAEESEGDSAKIGAKTRALVLKATFRGSICFQKYSGQLQQADKYSFAFLITVSGEDDDAQSRASSYGNTMARSDTSNGQAWGMTV
ncbi:MAG: hypothetical protein WCL08_05835, partial [Verrucomicrobiota bacterium]